MPGQVHNTPYLDCCSGPQVATIKTLSQGNHDCESLCQCQNCGAYWFYRFHEYVTFMDDDDDWTVWYSRLAPEQARLILEAKDRPDLSFLENAPGFMKDRSGVQRVTSQPTDPWM
jgi:hypothetical protein